MITQQQCRNAGTRAHVLAKSKLVLFAAASTLEGSLTSDLPPGDSRFNIEVNDVNDVFSPVLCCVACVMWCTNYYTLIT